MLRALIVATLCCISFYCFAKSPGYFDRIDRETGLDSNYINKILQRKDGFVWVATSEGIGRFDGYSFTNYVADPQNPSSIPSSWVETLFEDSSERLWVGTDKGLALLAPNESEFTVFKSNPNDLTSISGSMVSDIVEDKEGQIWIASNSGLNLYVEETNSFKSLLLDPQNPNDLPSNAIHFIEYDERFGFWLSTDQGLYQFNSSQQKFTKHNEVTELGGVFYDGDFDSHGNLWLATKEKGVIKYHPNSKKLITFRNKEGDNSTLASDYCWNVFIDQIGKVWVGTKGTGISVIDPKDNKTKRYQYSLTDSRTIPSNLVTSVMQDESGIVWVGTYNGIALFQANQIVETIQPIPYEDNSLSSELVWSIAETDNAIWIGTTEGLNREDKNSKVIENYNQPQKGNKENGFNAVWDIEVTSDLSLWLATEFGLALFDIKTKKINYSDIFLENRKVTQAQTQMLKTAVWAIKNNPDNSVWAGTNDGQLYRVDRNKGVVENFTKLLQDTLKSNSRLEFNNIIQDEDKNLWLSTSSGFYFLDTSRNVLKKVLNQGGEALFDNEWIYSTQHHKDNLYWISSKHYGVVLLEFLADGKVKEYLKIDKNTESFLDKTIHNLYPISESSLFMTGARNAYEYDIKTGLLTNFGSDSFLLDIVFHENSQFYGQDRKLYFGSTKGLVRFSPDDFKAAQKARAVFKPNVYVTDIETNSFSLNSRQERMREPEIGIRKKLFKLKKPLHKLDRIDFDHEQNSFSFKFAALSYLNSQNINYSYRLLGFDDNWSRYSLKREITYTNLPAGKYKLQVRASIGILDWSGKQAGLAFTISRAPWRTWPAYFSYLVVSLVLLSLFYRFWRKQLLTQYALDKSEVRLEQALWGSGDELWEWDLVSGEIILKNCFSDFEAVETLFNNLESLTQKVHADDIAQLKKELNDIVSGKSDTLESIYRRRATNGEWIWLLEKAKVTRFSDTNQPLRISGTTRNISNLKQAEEKNYLLASAFQSSTDGAIVLDSQLRIISINPSFSTITGYEDSILDSTLNPELISSGKTLSDGVELSADIMKEVIVKDSFSDEIWIKKLKGKRIPVDMRMASVKTSGGNTTHFIVTITDISFRKQAEKELRQLADFDSLTRLPNRAQLLRQLEYGILQVKRDSKCLAVLFIDLDNFKNVNDSLGHSSGDALLIAVAERLKKCVRRTDTVARLGGDEFTIGLLGIEKIDTATKVALDILAAMKNSFTIEGHELVISPSIGISIYGEDGNDVDTLLRHADIAMYHAKNNGRNNFEYFTQSMNEQVYNRIALEKRIRLALENEEFTLYFQPKFSLLGGHIVGFEALVRWIDPEHGIVPPDEFIPLAEETGLILPLGDWVINSACEQLRAWNQAGMTSLNLAVNLSAMQFRDKNLINTVSHAMEEHNINPENFELEITESSLIDDMSYTIKTLNELRALGVKLSLDDFGTGYSSLNYLKRFPIQCLKIDRSFVRDITNDKRDAKMVASIVALAHNLDIRVIGEGIEDREQLALLHQFGVDEGQGFFLGRPVDKLAATSLLEESQTISGILKPIIT